MSILVASDLEPDPVLNVRIRPKRSESDQIRIRNTGYRPVLRIELLWRGICTVLLPGLWVRIWIGSGLNDFVDPDTTMIAMSAV
jgi:hypothetical protein